MLVKEWKSGPVCCSLAALPKWHSKLAKRLLFKNLKPGFHIREKPPRSGNWLFAHQPTFGGYIAYLQKPVSIWHYEFGGNYKRRQKLKLEHRCYAIHTWSVWYSRASKRSQHIGSQKKKSLLTSYCNVIAKIIGGNNDLLASRASILSTNNN